MNNPTQNRILEKLNNFVHFLEVHHIADLNKNWIHSRNRQHKAHSTHEVFGMLDKSLR
jgi:hypothetical protein